jgi:uncharacterized protein
MKKYYFHSCFYIFIIFFSVSFLFIYLHAKEKKEDLKKYYSGIISQRLEKDHFFKYDFDSPLTKEQKKTFKSLDYYEPSSEFKFSCKLFRFKQPDTVLILTSKKNDIRKMLKYGRFNFVLKSKKCSLTVYLPLNSKGTAELFIPFLDQTNSKQTYHAGRYLDIELSTISDTYILDFNYCYNPYCAYNSKYSCPLVPNENKLSVSIKAGEKIFKK